MTRHSLDKTRGILLAGSAGIAIALIFNGVGRRPLSGVLSEDVIDAIAGMLYGVAFGLLIVGIAALARSRSDRNART